MRIGIPKEIKTQEYRVGLLPATVRELTGLGHRVLVETRAGSGVGATDEDYIRAGAEITASAAEVFESADMIVKVKEPQEVECRRLRAGQVLFTFLHLAADPHQATLLRESGAIAIAYETVRDRQGHLPLLAPMSEAAGRLAILAGSRALEKPAGGAGILLPGLPGVPPARVAILGGGVVGTNAARMALGLGADVLILDNALPRLRELDNLFGPALKTAYATRAAIEEAVFHADLVIGAVLVPGDAAPKLVTRPMLREMRPGSVLVDVSIDQGGCFETSRPTSHEAPTYVEEGIVHYAVTNMPGAVPRSSAAALNHASLPYVLALAGKGWRRALAEDPGLLAGLNVVDGQIAHPAVAHALGLTAADPAPFLREP